MTLLAIGVVPNVVGKKLMLRLPRPARMPVRMPIMQPLYFLQKDQIRIQGARSRSRSSCTIRLRLNCEKAFVDVVSGDVEGGQGHERIVPHAEMASRN